MNGTVADSTLLPGAGRLPVYSLNPNTYLDMAVDELGLWVIHADPEYGDNLIITKLDKGRACSPTHVRLCKAAISTRTDDFSVGLRIFGSGIHLGYAV